MILPRCFFDITINGVPSGRIVFELFSDVCPKTCENFRCLCTGEKGEGKTTFKPLHYSGTPIHRIVKGFIVQGGDFSSGDGTGGESIYGGMFKDENFKLKHDSPFLLSMANKGPNSNGSQFFITTRPATHLDGIHVVFGRVVSGQQYVNEIESQKVDANHRPYADVRISNSGELVLLKGGKSRRAKVELSTESSSQESSSSSSEESSSSESSSSSEEEVKKNRKRRRRGKPAVEKVDSSKKRGKRVKKRTRKKKQQSSDSESPDSGQPNAPPEAMVTSTVTEEDLPPEIVSTSRSWLYRYSRSPSPKDKPTSDTEGKKTTRPNRLPETGFKHRSNEVSQSGRKLKGRGLMRYRTPPRFIEHGGYERRWKSPPRRFRSRSRERGRYSPFRDRGRARSASPSPRRRSHRRRSHSSDSQGQSHRRKDRNRSVGVERERSPYSKDLERGPSDLDIGSKALKERVGKRSRRRSKQRSSGEDEARSRYLESPHGGHNRGRSPRKGKESEHDRPRQSSRKYTTPSPDKHQTSDHEKSPRDRQERRRSRDRKERKRRRSESLDAKRSRMYGKRSQKSPQQPSKWDRHFDSSSNSSEEEDQKLERAFQHGHRGGSGSGSEDVFGIAELSKQYFS